MKAYLYSVFPEFASQILGEASRLVHLIDWIALESFHDSGKTWL